MLFTLQTISSILFSLVSHTVEILVETTEGDLNEFVWTPQGKVLDMMQKGYDLYSGRHPWYTVIFSKEGSDLDSSLYALFNAVNYRNDREWAILNTAQAVFNSLSKAIRQPFAEKERQERIAYEQAIQARKEREERENQEFSLSAVMDFVRNSSRIESYQEILSNQKIFSYEREDNRSRFESNDGMRSELVITYQTRWTFDRDCKPNFSTREGCVEYLERGIAESKKALPCLLVQAQLEVDLTADEILRMDILKLKGLWQESKETYERKEAQRLACIERKANKKRK